ncbi:MAG: PaaX family transcriptional regulator C-terminal domain-containing protein [Acidimicrobiales bacterium]
MSPPASLPEPSTAGGATHDEGLDLRPLTARSVILSLLLGSHPPRLPVSALVRTADLFGISDGTLRVALSRMAAEGDVRSDQGVYELSDRLVERQRRQDEDRQPPTKSWNGSWEMAVIRPGLRPGSPGPEASAELRMAEMASGVWTRPENLVRPWSSELRARFWRLTTRPDDEPAALVAELWDLRAWAEQGRSLLAAMSRSADPARRFTIAAAILRHLRRDPLLPDELLPRDWPGDGLREGYRGFEAELTSILRDAREPRRHDS